MGAKYIYKNKTRMMRLVANEQRGSVATFYAQISLNSTEDRGAKEIQMSGGTMVTMMDTSHNSYSSFFFILTMDSMN